MAGERILIIEDDPTMLRGLKDNFDFAGYKVSTAATGEKGLDAALKLKPDLILLDLMLPGMNGYEICRAVREAELEMPIIMLDREEPGVRTSCSASTSARTTTSRSRSASRNCSRARTRSSEAAGNGRSRRCFGDFELDRFIAQAPEERPGDRADPEGVLAPGIPRPERRRAFTRDQLLNAVWGHDVFVTPRSVDRCVNTLRPDRSAARQPGIHPDRPRNRLPVRV